MSTFPAHIFRAYDIRGFADKEITPSFAWALACAVADFLRAESGAEDLTVVTGHDMRLSSPLLHRAVLDGLTHRGVRVLNAGLVSTPTFYFAVTHHGAHGGIMVSASHNPQEWNGFKITRAAAVPVSGETGMEALKSATQVYAAAEDAVRLPKGAQELVTALPDILETETDWVISQTNAAALPKLRVVADAANSMGAPYLSALFSRLDAELIPMNFELDGTFPSHEADPFKDENIIEVARRVVSEGADLGIATDGDGDRIFFFDETGARVEPQVVRAMLSENVLRAYPGAKICYDVRPGRITPEKIREAGGVPVQTRVGHSLIKEQSIREGARFAGESSGHMFFWYRSGFFEMPMLSVVKFLEELARVGGSVSKVVQPYRTYAHSGEINFTVRNKTGLFAALEAAFQDACLSRLDGLTVEYPDFWFNVRASNTEPKVRLNMEAKNQTVLEESLARVREILQAYE